MSGEVKKGCWVIGSSVFVERVERGKKKERKKRLRTKQSEKMASGNKKDPFLQHEPIGQRTKASNMVFVLPVALFTPFHCLLFETGATLQVCLSLSRDDRRQSIFIDPTNRQVPRPCVGASAPTSLCIPDEQRWSDISRQGMSSGVGQFEQRTKKDDAASVCPVPFSSFHCPTAVLFFIFYLGLGSGLFVLALKLFFFFLSSCLPSIKDKGLLCSECIR